MAARRVTPQGPSYGTESAERVLRTPRHALSAVRRARRSRTPLAAYRVLMPHRPGGTPAVRLRPPRRCAGVAPRRQAAHPPPPPGNRHGPRRLRPGVPLRRRGYDDLPLGEETPATSSGTRPAPTGRRPLPSGVVAARPGATEVRAGPVDTASAGMDPDRSATAAASTARLSQPVCGQPDSGGNPGSRFADPRGRDGRKAALEIPVIEHIMDTAFGHRYGAAACGRNHRGPRTDGR